MNIKLTFALRPLFYASMLVWVSACGRFDFGTRFAYQGQIPDAKFMTIESGQRLGFGSCSPLTVHTWALPGMPGTPRNPVPISVSGLLPGDRVYADDQCQRLAVPSDPTSLLLTPGAISHRVYVHAASLQPRTLQVSGRNLEPVSTQVDVERVVAKIAFSTPQSQVALGAGYCHGPIEFELQDADGQPFTPEQQRVQVSNGSGIVFSDSNCQTAIREATLDLSRTRFGSFYVRRNAVGTLTGGLRLRDPIKLFIASDVLGVSFESVPFSVAIVGGPARLNLGVCAATPLEIQLRDVEGRPVGPSAGTQVRVELGATMGSVASYRSSCQTTTGPGLSSITLAAGQASANVHVSTTTRNSVTLRAWVQNSLIAQATRTLPVDAPAYGLQVSGPAALMAGALSSAYTVTLVDALGASVNAASGGVPVELSGALLSTGILCSQAPCASNVLTQNRLTIPAGSSSAVFYFLPDLNATTGTHSLVATAVNGGLALGSMNVTVNRRLPAKLRISGGPPSGQVELGVCQSIAYNIELLDAEDRLIDPAPGSTLTVSLGFAAGSGIYRPNCGGSSVSQLVFSSGQVARSVYLEARARTSVTLRASATNLTPHQLSVQVITVPVAVSVTGPAAVIEGTVSSVFSVTLVDGLGVAFPAPTGGVTVAFSGTLVSSGRLCSGLPCGSNLLQSNRITIPAGSTQTPFYFEADAGATTGARSLAAQVISHALAGDTLTVNITERIPERLVISGGPGSNEVELGVCQPVAYSVGLLDAVGDPVAPAAESSVTVSLGFSAGTGEYRASCGGSVINQITFSAGQNTRTVYLRATSATSVTLRVTANGLTQATRTVAVKQVPVQLGISGPTTVRAGVPSGPYQVLIQDGVGATMSTAVSVTATLSLPLEGRWRYCLVSHCGQTTSSLEVTIPSGQSSATFYLLSDADQSISTQSLTASSGGGLQDGALALALTRDSLDLDPSFGTAGRTSTPFDGFSGGEILASLYHDGRLVAVGYQVVGGVKRFAMARYRVERGPGVGALDTAFGVGGLRTLPIGEESWASAVVRVGTAYLVAGSAKNAAGYHDFFLLRVSATGQIDTSFRHSGGVPEPLSVPGHQYSTAMAVGNDGTVYTVGFGNAQNPSASNSWDVVVAAFNASGALLSGGVAWVDVADSGDWARAVAVVAKDNRDYLIIGGETTAGTPRTNMLLARMNGVMGFTASTRLALDSGFGTGGVVSFDVGGNQHNALGSLLVQPNGRIVGAGARTSGGSPRIALFGVDSETGALDPSFGSAGIVLTDIPSVSNERLNAVTMDPRTQSLIVAGQAGADFLVARYGSNGESDGISPMFRRFNVPGNPAEVAWSVVLGQDNKPLVSGAANGEWSVLGLLR